MFYDTLNGNAVRAVLEHFRTVFSADCLLTKPSMFIHISSLRTAVSETDHEQNYTQALHVHSIDAPSLKCIFLTSWTCSMYPVERLYSDGRALEEEL